MLRHKLSGDESIRLGRIAKTASSDFVPTTIALTIKNRREYPHTNFPTNLHSLRIAGIDLARIDSRWFASRHLTTTLDLSDARFDLCTVDDWQRFRAISDLTQLRVFRLVNANLTRCPDLRILPRSIIDLDFSNNRISKLSIDIGAFGRLQRLTLANNHLIELPDQIGYLDQLRQLDVSTNRLKHVPLTLQWLRLNEIDLSSNDAQLYQVSAMVTSGNRHRERVASLLEYASVCVHRHQL